MEINFGWWVATVITSGLVGAIAGPFVTGMFGIRVKKAELTAERRARIEQRHDEASKELLEQAAQAVEWIQHAWGDVHGLDVDYVVEHDPPPAIGSATDAMAALRDIEHRHPTRLVRTLAAALRQGMSGQYGSITPVWDHRLKETVHKTGVDPDWDTFVRWAAMGDQLVDAMHSPPPLDDAKAASTEVVKRA